MLNEVNDSIEDALKLVKFAKIIPSKVNLIEFNLVDGINFKKSNFLRTKKFIEIFLN